MLRAIVVACVLLVTGCDRALLEQDPFVRPDFSGSLRVPLTAVDADGAHYRLAQVTLELGGPAMLTLTAGESADTALGTPLPEGIYSLFVRPGFRVLRRGDDGEERPVEAQLTSANPAHFSIGMGEPMTVRLSVVHAGKTLVFGGAPPVQVTRAP